MNVTHAVSLLACAFIVAGLVFRRDRARHRACMLAAFVIDMLLVFWIEVTRGALATTVGAGERSAPGPLLAFHIAVSVATVALYVIQLGSGTRLFRGRELSRTLHRRSGWAFVVFRFTNLGTSFLVAG